MPPMVGAPWWAASDRSKLFEKGRTTLAAAKRESLKRLPSAPQPPVESAPAEEDFPEDSEVEPPKSLPTLDRQRSSWVKALTLLKRKMGTEKQQPVKTSPTSLPSTMTKRRASFFSSGRRAKGQGRALSVRFHTTPVHRFFCLVRPKSPAAHCPA